MKEDAKPVAGEDEHMVQDDSTSGTSLTRPKALGVGAVALGGAALGGLADAGRAQAGTTRSDATVPDGAIFRVVLKRMAVDSSFRTQALQTPGLITKTYPSLTPLQLEALRNCAILSGENIAAINKVRAGAISSPSSQAAAGAIVVSGHSLGWTITISGCACCCCCCCGETAALVRATPSQFSYLTRAL